MTAEQKNPGSCEGCHFLAVGERYDILGSPKVYYCDFDQELDSNKPGTGIGFIPVKPDTCPIKHEKEPDEMHYAILVWNNNKWGVVFYSHNIVDFVKQAERYPQSGSCIHMADFNEACGEMKIKYAKLAAEAKERLRCSQFQSP